MSDASIGLRERKKRATHEALAHAAMRLAAEDGLEHLTVEAIARAADVSPRTFFNYFATKEDAVVATSRLNAEAVVRELRARPPGEALPVAMRAAIRSLLREREEVTKEWAQRVRLVRTSPSLLAAQLAAYTAVERSLAETIAERTGTDVDADTYPTMAAAMTMACWRVIGARWCREDNVCSLDELVTTSVDQLFLGAGTPAR
jgi:AcrR family transcriptional regulator